MKLLLIYLQLIISPTEFDRFVNGFSPKDYVVVKKFRQLPVKFRRSVKELGKLKFVKPSEYNSSDLVRGLEINHDRRRGAIYFAYSGSSAIIHYIHGGRGVHQHVYIIGISAEHGKWHNNLTSPKHENLMDLQKILKAKDYSETYTYDL